MSLRTSDYEERVFHELKEAAPRKISIRDIARATKLKDSTARRIVSAFEDMEFVDRVLIYPEEHFVFDPSEAGKRLKKYHALMEHEELIKRARLAEAEAHAAYARSR